MPLWPQDWSGIWLPDQALFESIIRVPVVLLVLFGLLRVVLKRESSGADISDLLVVVLIADAVQNGMAGGYSSITTALIVGATLIFWDWAFSWLEYHTAWFRKLSQRQPLQIVRNGKLIHGNARRELLTRHDIEEKLRLQGIPSLTEVKAAYIEDNGEISVIQKDDKRADPDESAPL